MKAEVSETLQQQYAGLQPLILAKITENMVYVGNHPCVVAHEEGGTPLLLRSSVCLPLVFVLSKHNPLVIVLC